MRLVLVVYLVVGGLVGVMAYREAAKFRHHHGSGPWGKPPAVWAAVCVVAGVAGALFLLFAERMTQRQQSCASSAFAADGDLMPRR